MGRLARGSGALAVVLGAVAGCSLIFNPSDFDTAPRDATMADGDDGAEASTDVVSENACTGGCPDCIVYVSAAAGDDKNDGCTTATPKKTIASAVALLVSTGGAGQEVHVCGPATYAENDLAVHSQIALRGAYNCATWHRLPKYGYPDFQRDNQTIVVPGPSQTNPSTLTIAADTGEAGVAALTIDGLTIHGAAGAQAQSNAVEITAGTPLVTDSVLEGGDGGTAATVGLLIDGTGGGEIRNDDIHGGSGTSSTGPGSTGLSITCPSAPCGAPHVHDNHIEGGNGTGTTGSGSVGLYASTAAALTNGNHAAIELNRILGGTGTSEAGSFTDGTSVGLLLRPAGGGELDVDVLHNRIEGGGGSLATLDGGAAPGAGPRGLTVASLTNPTAGAVHLDGNRIYGGAATTGESPAAVAIAGASIQFTIVNNMIHGGAAAAGTLPTGIDPAAVLMFDVQNSVIEANTIYGGGVFPTANGFEIDMPGSTNVVFRNNLLFGDQFNAGAIGFVLPGFGCWENAPFAAFENNAFMDDTFNFFDACQNGAYDVTTMQAAVLAANANAAVSGNVLVASSCSAEDLEAGPPSPCVLDPACTGQGACQRALFVSWSSIDDGYSELMDAGWMLKSGAPCRVARGGRDLSAPGPDAGPAVTTDLYGNPRSSMPSIGAHELDAGCD